MLRSNASTVLLSLLALSLGSFTFACSGHRADNSDVETSKLAVQKRKDGEPTGDGKTCSWDRTSVPTPVVIAPPPAPPPSGGSSGGCETDANGAYRCWSYDEEGREIDIAPSGSGSSTSSTGGVVGTSSGSNTGGGASGWTGSSSGSSGASGSSGGCAIDEQGNTSCWSSPPAPEPAPAPAPGAETYHLGEWFPSPDGCNQCTCTDLGIMCTVQACEPPTPAPMPAPAK